MNFPVTPVVNEIEAFAEMGFDYLELAMDPPHAHYTVIRQHEKDILNALDAHSMGLVCHLPTFVHTADLTPGIREASLSEMLNAIDVVAEMGVSKAVLHPSYVAGMGMFVMDTVRRHAFESLEVITARAEQRGILLCLENMPPDCGLLFEPEEFVEVFTRFSGLRLTLDIGHAHIESKRGKRILDFVERFGDRLGHVHISDNSGKSDEHLPMGKGKINFSKVIRSLKQAGYADTVTLEIFSEDRRELVASRKRFEKIVASCKL